MSKSPEIPWKRLTVEGAAIVVSILLAFSIDAWWGERQNAYGERIILQALLDDLQSKKVLLVESRQYSEAILEATIALLNAGSDPNSDLDGDALDELIQRTWWYNTSEGWSSAPLQSIVNGQLQSISNPHLIQKISELQIAFSVIKDFCEIDENFHFGVYSPFLIANAYMPQLTNSAEHEPGFPEARDPYPHFDLSKTHDHSDLLRRKDFHNMLIAKMDTVNSIHRYAYAGVEEQLDEAIDMLVEELSL